MDRRAALGWMGGAGLVAISAKAVAAPTPVKIKVVVVGDPKVGKSSLALRYTTGVFPEGYVPAVADKYIANMTVDGTPCLVEVVDTPADDRLRPLSYPLVNVTLITFSIVDPASLASVRTKWVPEISHHAPATHVVVVGTKSDLRDDATTKSALEKKGLAPVTKAQAETIATSVASVYVESSAKAGPGVNLAFETAVRRALAAARIAPATPPPSPTDKRRPASPAPPPPSPPPTAPKPIPR